MADNSKIEINLSTFLFSAFLIVLNDANMDAEQCRLSVFVARTRSFFEARTVPPNLHSYDKRLYLKRSTGGSVKTLFDTEKFANVSRSYYSRASLNSAKESN